MSMIGDGTDGGAPGWTWRDRERAARSRGVVLDPATQPAGGPDVYPTVYQPDVLLVRADAKSAVSVFARLNDAAAEFGWKVTEETGERPGLQAESTVSGPPPRKRRPDETRADRGPARCGDDGADPAP